MALLVITPPTSSRPVVLHRHESPAPILKPLELLDQVSPATPLFRFLDTEGGWGAVREGRAASLLLRVRADTFRSEEVSDYIWAGSLLSWVGRYVVEVVAALVEVVVIVVVIVRTVA